MFLSAAFEIFISGGREKKPVVVIW